MKNIVPNINEKVTLCRELIRAENIIPTKVADMKTIIILKISFKSRRSLRKLRDVETGAVETPDSTETIALTMMIDKVQEKKGVLLD